jgi:serine/threonine protein kinase
VSTDEHRFGNYVLEEQLAKGGMAEVWRARRVGVAGFARKVCVKQILPAHADDRAFLEMFIDEANTGAQLRHGNIVGIDDFGQIDGRYFIAMEFVAGIDLARLLRHLARAHERLPIDVAVFVAREVLAALDYAHRKMSDRGTPLGIVHRDVSPHNVLLSSTGEVKLTDFGIAKAASRLHQTVGLVVKGKLAYMAPEQARLENVDGRADLFALGVIFYEMLTGERPFARPNDSEMLHAVVRGERQPVQAMRSDLPASVARVVEKLLATKREDRYASGGEAIADLAEYPASAGAGQQLAALVSRAAAPRASRDASSTSPAVNGADAVDDPRDATLPDLVRSRAETSANSISPIDYAAGGTEIASTWAAERDAPTMISDVPSHGPHATIASTRVTAGGAPAEARETSPTDATRTIARGDASSVPAETPTLSQAAPAQPIRGSRPRGSRALLTIASFGLLALSAIALGYVLLAR